MIGCGGRVAAEAEGGDGGANDSQVPALPDAFADSAPRADTASSTDAADPVDSASTDSAPVDTEPPLTGDSIARTINVMAMALTDDDVVWSDGPGSGSVFSVKKTGGPTKLIVKLGPTTAVAVD